MLALEEPVAAEVREPGADVRLDGLGGDVQVELLAREHHQARIRVYAQVLFRVLLLCAGIALDVAHGPLRHLTVYLRHASLRLYGGGDAAVALRWPGTDGLVHGREIRGSVLYEDYLGRLRVFPCRGEGWNIRGVELSIDLGPLDNACGRPVPDPLVGSLKCSQAAGSSSKQT